MTAITDAPWFASDELRRKKYQAEAGKDWAKQAGEHGQSDDSYRAYLAEWRQHKANFDGIEKMRDKLRRQLDEVVARHLDATRAPQAELADPATPVERLIECRMLVQDLNDTLKAETEPLKKRLAATEEQWTLLRNYVSGITGIENAFIAAGPQQDRMWALDRASDLLQKLLIPHVINDADKAQRVANDVKEKNEDVKRPNHDEIADTERKAKKLGTVLGIMRGWQIQAARELEDIRRQRLAELRAP